MKHKTSDLSGALLDAAVALADGITLVDRPTIDGMRAVYSSAGSFRDDYSPSTSWALAGPIIERERISVFWVSADHAWSAGVFLGITRDDPQLDVVPWCVGPTPLIAAMRAFVVSKVGREIDLPDDAR
jgi:hypothetical protein